MVYLDAYHPRQVYLTGLGAFHSRRRYLSALGAYHPRQRYLNGLGCGSGACGCKMLSALGDDLTPPNIAPSGPGGTPTLFASTGGGAGDIMVAPPPGTSYGPATPPGLINTLPVPAPAPVAGSFGPAPVAPAINYASPAAMQSLYASALAPPLPISSSPPGTILGIPMQYFVYGGIALVGLSVLGGMKKGGRRR